MSHTRTCGATLVVLLFLLSSVTFLGSYDETDPLNANDGLSVEPPVVTGHPAINGLSNYAPQPVFLPNQGLVEDQKVRFVSWQGTTSYSFLDDGYLIQHSGAQGRTSVIQVEFNSLSGQPPLGQDRSDVNYKFLGQNKGSHSKESESGFHNLFYYNVLPGVDIKFHFSSKGLKYDVLVAPGADASTLKFSYHGLNDLFLDSGGDLHLVTNDATFVEQAPYSYQLIDGLFKPVNSAFIVDGFTISYNIGTYDRQLPLVIDPLIYSTYLGGMDANYTDGVSLTVDEQGYLYACGHTLSPSFPTTAGSYQKTKAEGLDIVVSKLDPNGTTLIYATFLGGSGNDRCTDIEVNDAGQVYLTGYTDSSDLPVTSGAYASALSEGSEDAFMFILNQTGQELELGTYFGGSGIDRATGIELDPEGQIFIAGNTTSTDLPVSPGALLESPPAKSADWNCFLSRFNPAGSELLYSTYYGGTLSDNCQDLVLDKEGRAYVTGDTLSPDLLLGPSPYDDELDGVFDAFLARFNTSLDGIGGLEMATYIGGSSWDKTTHLALGPQGEVYLLGQSWSEDLPISEVAFQSTTRFNDLFLVRFDIEENNLTHGTYLGGSSTEWTGGLAVDEFANVYVSGTTYSDDLHNTSSGLDQTFNGNGDAFLNILNWNLTELLYGSYLGGENYDAAMTLALDPRLPLSVFLTGSTTSHNFPVSLRALDKQRSGVGYGRDAFLMRLSPSQLLPWAHIETIQPANLVRGDLIRLVGRAEVQEPQPAPDFLWYSNLDGPLGKGEDLLFANNLSVGRHRIMLRVRDGSGNLSDWDSRSVLVKPSSEPQATILSISPNPALQGQVVTFHGGGQAPGNITEYKWRSDKDGHLFQGNTSNFKNSELRLGDHIIYLRVKDDQDNWSDETGYWLRVVANQAPILSPSLIDGTVISGLFNCSGTAHDVDGKVAKMEFKVGKGDWYLANGTRNWYFNLDTRKLPEGQRGLFFRVTDEQGLTTSMTYSIWVGNHPPDFSITIQDLSLSQRPHNGSQNTLKLKVWNHGTGDGQVEVQVFLQDGSPNGTFLSNFSGPMDLTAGKHIQLETLMNHAQEGPMALSVRLVDHSKVAETNLLNNQAELLFVASPARVDKEDETLLIAGAPAKQVATGIGLFSLLFMAALLVHESFRIKTILLLFPLYSHLRKDDIEKDLTQQTIRGRIYQHIIEQPGTHFSNIRKSVAAGNGSTCYHLDVLEREGFVKSIKRGRCRYYFKTGTEFPQKLRSKLSPTAFELLESLYLKGPASVSQLAERIAKSIPTASDTLKSLERLGYVKSERHHKVKVCRLTLRGEDFISRFGADSEEN